MRVLIVSPAYTSSRRGGAEVVAARSAQGFQELGWEVTILAAGEEGTVRLPEGVLCRLQPWNFCDLESVRLLPVVLRYLWAAWDATGFGARMQLKKILEANKFDLIVVHGLRGLGYGLLPVLTKAAKVVYVAHDVQLLEPSGILYPATADAVLGGVSRRVYRWYMQKLSSYVPTAVFASDFLKDFYSTYGYFTRATTAVVANPMGEVRTKEAGSAITVVFDGQLERQKGIYVLLEAWSQLAKLDATLLIIGEGSALATVRTAAAKDKRIHYLSRLQGEQKNAVYDAASLFVLPSLLIENSPVLVCEALLRGIPVVASNVGGIPDLLKDAAMSEVVLPGNSQLLADAIIRVVTRCRNGETQAPHTFPTSVEYAKQLLALSAEIQK